MDVFKGFDSNNGLSSTRTASNWKSDVPPTGTLVGGSTQSSRPQGGSNVGGSIPSSQYQGAAHDTAFFGRAVTSSEGVTRAPGASISAHEGIPNYGPTSSKQAVGLAPPLGALDSKPSSGPSFGDPAPGSSVASGLTGDSLAPSSNRLDSSASTTAIHHGKPGDLHGDKGISPSSTSATTSSLGTVTEKEKALPVAPGTQQSTIRGTGPNVTSSRTPGTEQGAVGHVDKTLTDSDKHHQSSVSGTHTGTGIGAGAGSGLTTEKAHAVPSTPPKHEANVPDSPPSAQGRTGSGSSASQKKTGLINKVRHFVWH